MALTPVTPAVATRPPICPTAARPRH
jgi:hypothetical protein